MPEPSPIFAMAMFTMTSALVFGYFQARSASKALEARARRRNDRLR